MKHAPISDGLGGTRLPRASAKRVSVTMTVAQWDALWEAARYALTPGCEWNDCEDGVGDPIRNDRVYRAIEILKLALDQAKSK